MHKNSETPANAVESEFLDIIQHADDFLKIELLRQAKSWYKKALKLNIQTEEVEKKISECDRLLAFENKIVRILGAIAIVLLAIYLFV